MAIDAHAILAISASAPAKNLCFPFGREIAGMQKSYTSENKSTVQFVMAIDANASLAISVWAPAKHTSFLIEKNKMCAQVTHF